MTFTPRWDAPLTDSSLSPGAAQPAAPHPLLVADSGPDSHGLSVEVTLHTGLDLARIDSRFHDIDIQPLSGGYRIELTDPEARSDRPFELGWTVAAGDLPRASVYTWDSSEAVYALLMLVPPLAETLSPTAREVVFVIDTSGSMEGTSIRQAREALRQGLDHLEPDDLFNLVRFDSDAELLFEASVPPSSLEIGEAREYIDRLVAGGGTNMAPALELAMGLPARPGLLRQIVFITDGSVGNEQELLRQIGDRLGDSRLFTVSIGAAPNEWFMRKAAEIGRGTHRHIGRQDEVGQRMAELWLHLENPAVQGLCVDWGMEAEYYPEVLPDLYAGEPLWLRAKLPFEPLEVTLCGELEGRHWEAASAVLPIAGGETLGALWARSKIEALEDGRLFGMDPEAVRRDVLALALEFGLLTPWTSLVAVDRTPARPAGADWVTTEVPGLLPAGSTLSSGFPPTATAWPLRLGLALLSLSLASGMLLYRPRGRRRPAGTRQPGASFST
jgi:Ca-activated chloride channel family protein